MKKTLCAVLAIAMVLAAFSGCGSPKYAPAPSQEEVTLTVAGPWPECTGLDAVTAAFTARYPNCHIVYEYLQNFDENLLKRISEEDGGIDFYLGYNSQKDSPLLPYTVEFSSLGDKLDLSHTFAGLVDNFRLQSTEEADQGKLYSIPLGAEVRGMYVNVTLLNSLGLEVPTTRTELLEACEVLKEAGYIPLQGNPGQFAVLLMYPYLCNQIANADDYERIYDMVNSRSAEALSLYREPFQFLYGLVRDDYYKYKYVENELKLFTDTTSEGYARSFLNIAADADGNYYKVDDLGQVAFMPFTLSLDTVIQKTKEDYHSEIEYEFILSPVSESGGYAYMSPARGISICANSANMDWSVLFLNYLFEEETNTAFCDKMGYLPNTENAFQIISEMYNIPETSISHVGQVTFNYEYYSIVEQSLIEISKGNNPKYMQTDEDGNTSLYPFDYYMDKFAANFIKQ